jgi:hypothetical protein
MQQARVVAHESADERAARKLREVVRFERLHLAGASFNCCETMSIDQPAVSRAWRSIAPAESAAVPPLASTSSFAFTSDRSLVAPAKDVGGANSERRRLTLARRRALHASLASLGRRAH